MYIRATGNISPQNSFGHPAFLTEVIEHFGNRLACVEPGYKEIIDAKMIRRMSRIIKMGVAAAMECLLEAGITVPDAIVTGTSYGCMEDTGLFLTKMVENKEELLTPTAFIQSTHNTIGAQIGLMLQCHNYNNAFVHRGFSFESALLDAVMLLQENEASNVLVGAVDEITNTSHAILSRFGLYKQEPVSNLQLFANKCRGTIAGEGAAFFVLAREASGNDYAKLDGLKTFYKPASEKEIESNIYNFLSGHSLSVADIDLVITGNNGDARGDEIYDWLAKNIFTENNTIPYKQLCGEYPTATAFALWMAAGILKSGSIPASLVKNTMHGRKIKRLLIYNNYLGVHHSLFLLSAC